MGMSLWGCTTVTRPGLSGWVKWWWLPLTFLSSHPSRPSLRITSLLSMCALYTPLNRPAPTLSPVPL